MQRRPVPVARQMLVLQVGVVVLLVLALLGVAAYDARRDARAEATERSLAVASAVADSPAVSEALSLTDPSTRLQPFAEQVRSDTEVDFITIMALDRTRYTHPDPANIGKRFIGDVGDAPAGGTFTQEYAGTLGPSMRAVVPVRDAGGDVVALVSVGITVSSIQDRLRDDVVSIGVASAPVLLVGLLGVWLLSRRLRRQTHGMGELEMTRMYEYYSAVLHAVREGLLLIDPQGKVQLVNDEARRLLDLPDDVVGRQVQDLGLAPGLVGAALSPQAESDDLYVAGDRMLVVSSAPARWDGRSVGAVVSLRDHTELQAVTGELAAVRGLTDALRAQNHEAANRLHTVVSLFEIGQPDTAIAFATEELEGAQQLTDLMVGAVGDPAVSALLVGKTAAARERGIELTVDGGLEADVPGRDLVTVVGNLVDNAFDALDGHTGPRRVRVVLGGPGDHPAVTVEDSGPGLSAEEAGHVLERGWSTKAEGRGVGLALVHQVARRHGGVVRIGRSDLGGASFTVELGPVVRA
ncbi:sensor histidine kinase [Nocardioides sp.]|uniref:sensor histidine kinase n=1 Tax=Nocardioides sp. TaxID=35761 RepID=UPI00272638AD|nr:sensor histidine kinase [Nocardioides sp.]MDO9454570.1 sensor histidine kinase [Nocardioides sp.]